MHVVQVVPELPPAVGGVGDYAFLLAAQLRRLGLETTFVLADRSRSAADGSNYQTAVNVSPILPRADALARHLNALSPTAVLVHYSGYGFAKRGAPVWLVQGLRCWKASAPAGHLVVMFHELWASALPWRSSFWLYPVQRALVAALLRLADAYLTSTELYARRLRRFTPHRSPAAILPVLSNIGEPTDPPPLDAREPLAAVFGGRGARRRVYCHIQQFLPALRAAGIEALLDIGPPVEEQLTARSPLPVTRSGYLEAPLASAAMLRARFGLLDRPIDFAAKSGILAAYAAHGLVPVIRTAPAVGAPDRLRHGVNVVQTQESIPHLPEVAQQLATAVSLWYRDHAAGPTAAGFGQALRSSRDLDRRA